MCFLYLFPILNELFYFYSKNVGEVGREVCELKNVGNIF